jgi:S-adenosylmethionine-diacylglycerol 3-amino-3-carboxypropyl transferase
MRRLACDFPLADNPYAQQAFARRYDTGRQSALPMYLQQQHYAAIREHSPRLHSHHCSLTDFLVNRPSQSLDAYLFLDAQDWMDDAQLNALWREVTRTAARGARVVFRTGGSASPLETRLAPQVRAAWCTDPDHNRELHRRDRAAIYGGVHLYIKQT